MKNKLAKWFAALEQKKGVGAVMRGIRAGWGLVAHNIGLKLLSLLIAILLWNFVITSNTSITRSKTISGLTGYVTGQNTLSSVAELALLEDPLEKIDDVSVIVEVSQADFANVNKNNVQVTLDLSSVRRAGVQEVPLKATTSYGRVVQIIPATVPVALETLDSRVIPVNVQMTGKQQSDRWYKVGRTNPTALTIKGPASVVQSIASAYVDIDVTGARSSFTAAEHFILQDSEGNEIPQTLLERSSTSVSVNMDVYPVREIPISDDLDEVISGVPADGYVVESITIQPDVLSVAAEQELLDSIDLLHVESISVEGLSQSFSQLTEVSAPSALKSISADEVYVNVTIAEETVGAWIEDVKISYVNKSEGLTLVALQNSVRVYVTGPRSEIESLQQAGFVATVDLTGLKIGRHLLTPEFPVSTFPDVTFTPEASEISVTLTD